jgi:hypothetical protein
MTPNVLVVVVLVVQGGALRAQQGLYHPLTLCRLLFIVHTQMTLASERTHLSGSGSSTSSPMGWFRSSERDCVITPSVEEVVKKKVQGGGLGDQGGRYYPMTL